MYTPLEMARELLWERRRDLDLRRRIDAHLGNLPEFLHRGPHAVLARQLATPNFEFHTFAARARQVGLRPIALDYLGDKFYPGNPEKLALAKPTFLHGKGRNGGDKTVSRRIVDCNRWSGKPLRQVRTLWNESLSDCHHRLLTSSFPGMRTGDCSDWLRQLGGKPALFWSRVMALFLSDAILLENFHREGHEADFTRSIILPALQAVRRDFGLSPLIVPLVPVEQERDPFWSWYPGHLETSLEPATARPVTDRRFPAAAAARPGRGGAHA